MGQVGGLDIIALEKCDVHFTKNENYSFYTIIAKANKVKDSNSSVKRFRSIGTEIWSICIKSVLRWVV